MYASVVAWTFKPGTNEQVRRTNLEVLIPATQQQPGFRQFYAIRSGEDSYVTVILYESKEAAEAAIGRLTPLIRQHQGAILEGMQRYAGEVEVALPLEMASGSGTAG